MACMNRLACGSGNTSDTLLPRNFSGSTGGAAIVPGTKSRNMPSLAMRNSMSGIPLTSAMLIALLSCSRCSANRRFSSEASCEATVETSSTCCPSSRRAWLLRKTSIVTTSFPWQTGTPRAAFRPASAASGARVNNPLPAIDTSTIHSGFLLDQTRPGKQ